MSLILVLHERKSGHIPAVYSPVQDFLTRLSSSSSSLIIIIIFTFTRGLLTMGRVDEFSPLLSVFGIFRCLSLITSSLWYVLNPLECKGNYSAKFFVHWPLMGALIHLVQRGRAWVGPQSTQAPPRCTKCYSPPISGQCINHRIAV